jgi:hypothetical protein
VGESIRDSVSNTDNNHYDNDHDHDESTNATAEREISKEAFEKRRRNLGERSFY